MPRQPKRVLLRLTLLASLLQCGCSLLTTDYENLKAPKVSLTSLGIKDINPLNPRFLVRLKLDNPNDAAVSMDGADVALALNGLPVAEGISRSPLTLNRLGSSEMDVEVSANTFSALQQLLLLQSKPALDYQLTGHLHLLDGLGALGQLPFSFTGTVDRQTLMSNALGQR